MMSAKKICLVVSFCDGSLAVSEQHACFCIVRCCEFGFAIVCFMEICY